MSRPPARRSDLRRDRLWPNAFRVGDCLLRGQSLGSRPIALVPRLLSIMAFALVLTACGAPEPEPKIAVGVGEQDAAPFAEGAWKTAGLRKSRIVIPFDVALKRNATRAKMDAFYLASRTQRVELLVAFNPTESARCPGRPCEPPSLSDYAKAFRAFRSRYPKLTVVAPVNEGNHNTQPTYREPRAGGAVLQPRPPPLPGLHDRGGRHPRREQHGQLATGVQAHREATRASGDCTTTRTPTRARARPSAAPASSCGWCRAARCGSRRPAGS